MIKPMLSFLLALAILAGVTTSSATASSKHGHDRDRDRDRCGHNDNRGEKRDKPIVIGHRGASGYRPEHTLEAYALAARQGADFIEPDLVITKDGVLVARHENEIGSTTDVSERPEFADRKTTKTIDGVQTTGWFTEDFTLRELKTLRAKERIPQLRPGNTAYDGKFEVPTFDEVLELRAKLSRELDREIGVYPETKHPTYFQQLDLALERPLLRSLRRFGLDRRRSPVYIQSFEVANLRDLSRKTRVPLVQLLNNADSKPYDFVVSGDPRTYRDLAGAAGLREVASYADGVGPYKELIIPRDQTGRSLTPTNFVRDAHRAGLEVHPWTLRAENQFLPLELRSSANPSELGDMAAEVRFFLALGVDGVFSDQPDIAVKERDS